MTDPQPGTPVVQGVTRFRKRPVEVSAIQWTGANLAEVQEFTGRGYFDAVDPQDRGDDPDMTAMIFDKLHSTWVHVYDGQWVIKGVQGEFYPITDAVLAATYEPAGGQAPGSLADRLASALHAIGETSELLGSLMKGSPGAAIAECGPDILDSLRISGVEIDAAVPVGAAAESPAPTFSGPATAATDAAGGTAGVALIRAERLRQIAAEGYTAEHDARHDGTQLARAAACYALHAAGVRQIGTYPLGQSWPWPWPQADFKPGTAPLDALVKAGALIAAELDRRIAAEAGHD